MQLIEETADRLGVADRYDPEENIRGGVELLAELYKKYGKYGDDDRIKLAAANYNCGGIPAVVGKYCNGLENSCWDMIKDKLGPGNACPGTTSRGQVETVRHVNAVWNNYNYYRSNPQCYAAKGSGPPDCPR